MGFDFTECVVRQGGAYAGVGSDWWHAFTHWDTVRLMRYQYRCNLLAKVQWLWWWRAILTVGYTVHQLFVLLQEEPTWVGKYQFFGKQVLIAHGYYQLVIQVSSTKAYVANLVHKSKKGWHLRRVLPYQPGPVDLQVRRTWSTGGGRILGDES